MPPTETEQQTEERFNLELEPLAETRKYRKAFWVLFILFDLLIITPLILAVGAWYVLNQAPSDFSERTITIEQGTSVQKIAELLATENVVQSELLLLLNLRFAVDSTKIQAGSYKFTDPQTTKSVAEQLASGEIYHELLSVTFIEGVRTQEFAVTAAESLPLVTTAEFVELTQGLEGRLFPETYFVPDDFTTRQLVDLLTDTHDLTMDELLQENSTQLSDDEIRTLASIVEREANTPESMRTVAGVFMNRITIGMPLQADASIEYVLDTPLGELPPGQLAAELRELESPYNTYLNPGLPPTPIGNPGKVALAAVIDPIESDYFYYITGNDGQFYYAETYNQHLINIERHLR